MTQSTRPTRPVHPTTRIVTTPRRVPAAPTSSPRDPAPRWLSVPAAYAWRFVAIAAGVTVIGLVIARIQLVLISLFVALVIAAVLRPIVAVMARHMPRWAATTIALLTSVIGAGAILAAISVSVAGQIPSLTDHLSEGLDTIQHWLASTPFQMQNLDVTKLGETIQKWVADNQAKILSVAATQAAGLARALTGLAFAIFSSVFFINSGSSMWRWFLRELPQTARPAWSVAGSAAWETFSGYTRGILIVAGTNGLLAGVGLTIFGVPLAVPLGVLVFVGTFIPYIGSPIALAVASLVALATRGPLVALGVLAMIIIIGQLEGHVLQPLVMGHQVKVHPIVIAASVICGTLVGSVLGAIVAVPIVSVCWAVFSRLRSVPPGDPAGDIPDVAARVK